MSELLIRPTHNDHVAISDLVVPADKALLAPVRRPISRLVLDAPLAARTAQYREAAAEAGIAVLVDPLSYLLQVDTDPADAWTKLPFARADAMPVDELANAFALQQLVEEAVAFQVDHGASTIIAPYFYARSTDDPAFAATLEALRLTARFLRSSSTRLPLVAVLCGSRRGFSRGATFAAGVDRFAATALDLGPQMLAFCLSPMGDGKEGDAKVLQLLTVGQRLKSTGASVVAWRQGFYGSALVAAGLDGYETGTGVGERTNITALQRSKAPGARADGGDFVAPRPVYFEGLGRSVPHRAAEVLLEQRASRALLVCRDARCCPHGPDSMLGANRRQHNIRTRARALRDLEPMPHTHWRLHQVAKNALASALDAGKVNEHLAEAGEKFRVPTRGYEALAHAAELLSRRSEPRAA